MIQMKTYMMTLKRMMMTVLMMLITVSAMSAEQKIWLHISGNGKAQVSLDGNVLTFDKDNMTTVKEDAPGKTVTVSVKPDNGYTVTSVTAQLTTDAGNATRGADDAGFLDVKKASDTEYTFEMPKDFNVRIYVTISKKESGSKGPDYSGTYYLANNNLKNNVYDYKGYDNADNFYLCPSDAYYDNGSVTTTPGGGKPFLTTYKTGQAGNSLWIVEKVTNTNYYTFKQKVGNSYKYLTVHNQLTGYSANRMRVHLEEIASDKLDDHNYFTIQLIVDNRDDGIKGYTIGCVDAYKNNANQYLNPADGNKPSYSPTEDKKDNGHNIGGMVGFYKIGALNSDASGSLWFFEVPKPIIHIDDNSRLTFSCANENVTIHYTIDGGNPSATGTEDIYNDTDNIILTEGNHTIRAIAVMNSGNTGYASGIITQEVQKVATPTITINADNSVTITCSTADATIYYKLGGDAPTTANGIQSSTIASILPSQGPIKAIAAKEGWLNSSIAEESTIPAKTITVSSTNASLTSTDPIVYNGTAQQPAFTIMDGEATIAFGEYTVEYSNNTNAGTNTATVTITDNDNGDYIVSGSFTFSIEKKPVTITSGIKVSEKSYDGTTAATLDCSEAVIDGIIGEDDLTITATGVFAGKDVVISEETVQPIEVAISKENITLGGEAVGNYKLADDGHQATTSAKINPAPLTITANDKTISYGEAPTNDGVTFGEDDGNGGTINGFVNNETETVLTGTLSYDYNSETDGSGTSYTTTTSPGTFYIIPSGLTSTNYAITFKYGTLTVSQKSLSQDENGTPADDFDVDITKNSDGDYVVTVKQGEQTLEEGVAGGDENDFSWEYGEPDADGVVEITITGHGNYGGEAKAKYVNLNFFDDTPNDPTKTETAAVFCTSDNLQSVGEIEAWYVSAINSTTKEMTITKVETTGGDNYIPADQPILLLGDATSKGFMLKSYSGETVTIGTNLLLRATDDVAVPNKGVYVFHEGEFVLSMWGAGQTISAGHYYVNLTGSPAPTRMAIVKNSMNTRTSIDGIKEDENMEIQSEIWYTLDGRRLSSKPTQKGIYITNDRKVVIK